MSSCHQGHNIPWSCLVDNLEVTEDGRLLIVTYNMLKKQPRSRHGMHGLYQKEVGMTELQILKKFRHFASRFAKAIREFSLTERKKDIYNEEKLSSMTKIFDDEECEDGRILRLGEHQTLSYWKPFYDSEIYYGKYNEFVSELFRKDLVHSVVYMARNGLTLEKSWTYFIHYVIHAIFRDTLELYLHLNLMIAKGTMQIPSQNYTQSKDFFMRLHNAIAYNTACGGSLYAKVTHLKFLVPFFEEDRELQNPNTRKELLNLLFRRLYLYDMAMREGGGEWEWEKVITDLLFNLFWIPMYQRKYSQRTVLALHSLYESIEFIDACNSSKVPGAEAKSIAEGFEQGRICQQWMLLTLFPFVE